jgi:hypothetical protein
MKIKICEIAKTIPFMDSQKKEFIQISGITGNIPDFNQNVAYAFEKDFGEKVSGNFLMTLSKSNSKNISQEFSGILSLNKSEKNFSFHFILEISDSDWDFVNEMTYLNFAGKDLYLNLEEVGASNYQKQNSITEFKVACKNLSFEIKNKSA